jgi:homoserine/homoserine lactone efflux protein
VRQCASILRKRLYVELTRLLAFCGSYFLIALSPGLCMTLAMSLGISIGVRRTLWMMLGEVVGIALVGGAAMAGVAAMLKSAPQVFAAFKVAGAAYLLWTAWLTWNAAVAARSPVRRVTPAALCSQGFLTAVSNPKAWAFQAALLPPFIDPKAALAPQMIVLLALMVVIEFACLLIYAQGGRSLSELLLRRGQGQLLNRVSAILMTSVALWLLLG